MSIKFAILGFLSWKPMTGYDIKKIFADSEILYWSGNNNQIYRTLVKLHEEDLVTREIEYQEDLPPRKVYTITAAGQNQLREWILSTPELPQLKNPFLIQLAWSDQLDDEALETLLDVYEKEVYVKFLMLKEQNNREQNLPARTQREILLWESINANLLSFYEHELNWVRGLRQALSDLKE